MYFTVDNGLTWSEQQKLIPSDAAAEYRFGSSVAVSFSTMVVGSILNSQRGLNAGVLGV